MYKWESTVPGLTRSVQRKSTKPIIKHLGTLSETDLAHGLEKVFALNGGDLEFELAGLARTVSSGEGTSAPGRSCRTYSQLEGQTQARGT